MKVVKVRFPITGGDCAQGYISFEPIVFLSAFLHQKIHFGKSTVLTAILQEAKFNILGVEKT